jgi:hypothetical protein
MKMTAKSLIYAALMVFCLMLCSGPALAAGTEKDAAPEKAKESVKPNSEAASDKERKDLRPSPADDFSRIDGYDSDFRIRLRTVDGKRTYRIGDEIALEFKTSEDAYVTIIDVGTSGKTHVLFPNKWNRENFVEAGRWYRIPGRRGDRVIRVEGPAGINYVKAIATRDRHEWFSKNDLVDKGAFSEVKDPSKIAKDLGVDLRDRDRKGWTEEETNIRIIDRRGDKWDDEWDRGRDRRHDRDRDWTSDWDRDRDRDRDRYRDNFLVKLWTSRKSYRVGDPLRIFFYAEKDCYLNLIDFGTSGRARVIFPNRYQRDNFVRGGTVIEIPGRRDDEFRYTVGGPRGVERLKAIASRDKLKLYRGSYDWDKYVFQPWDEKSDLVYKDIKVRLDDMRDDEYVTTRTKFRVRR